MLDIKKKVFIMRGISGSGKSTMVKKIVKEELKLLMEERKTDIEDLIEENLVVICSADDFFMKNGNYEFDIEKISEAHDFCLRKYIDAIFDASIQIVFVDNTHTELWEYIPYITIARAYSCEITVVEVHRDVKACIQENKHGVPVNVIEAQQKRFQPTPKEYSTRVIIIGELPNFWTRFKRWLIQRV